MSLLKILFFLEGNWLSHVSRPLCIARELRSRGHQITFACSGRFTYLIETEGFEIYPIFTKDPDMGLSKARLAGTAYDNHIVMKYIKDEIECIKKLNPDIVICDFRLTVKTSSEFCRKPYVSIINGYWTNYYSAVHTAPDSLRLVKFLGKRVSCRFYPFIKHFLLKKAVHPFNRSRRILGLPPCFNIFDAMESDLLNLVPDLPDYAPLKDFPDSFTFIGPILWEPEIPTPEWLAKVNREQPVLYFTIGSTGFNSLFDVALSEYAQTDTQVIMSIGDTAITRKIPPNFYVEPYVPGLRVLDVSDVVICHGGNGTIYQAFSKGVPVVGIPTMHDQWFNMERVETLGAGTKVTGLEKNPKILINAINKILKNQRFAANARYLKTSILKYNAPKTAACCIERCLE